VNDRTSRPAVRPWVIAGVVALAAAVVLAVVVAGGDDEPPEGRPGAEPTEGRCVLRLHGKGGEAQPTEVEGGVTYVEPGGNAAGWGGREWRYFPESAYEDARDIVVDAADEEGCEQVIVHGFSNGGAFAAKLYCQGETLGGRLVGVVVDDPVPDHGVVGCDPAGEVDVTLYWTGALEATAQPGWDCAEDDWTCEGGTTIGIAAYADELGTPAVPSRYSDHLPYLDAPEVTAFE
jgi:dienelactone hydrolase